MLPFLKVSLPLLFVITSCLRAAPCVSASKECEEWVSLGSGARSLIYRTYSINAKNETITRALVVVHGSGRDADNYFRTSLAAAFLGGALENTIVIAPRFASNNDRTCHDALAEGEVNWSCSGDSWRSGGFSTNYARLSSYDFLDEVLRRLARKEIFPNLKVIVVAGHSAGGQFVNRYEMANKVHDKLGITLQYVASNPSSYAYLSMDRPDSETEVFKSFRDARNCTTYDQWPYGLEKRTGYTAALSDEQLKTQFAARPTTYLLGQIDILPLGGFDASCPAMAEGPTRLARGQSFQKYVNDKFKAAHKVVVVPLCGHNARCMFTSEIALPILFPKQ
jgi:poly(3-hydroxybutyrate) depolymerase